MTASAPDAHILIGLGREGFSSCTFIRDHHPQTQILAYDDKNVLQSSEKWQKIAKNDQNIHFFSEKTAFIAHLSALNTLKQALALRTPGIARSHPVVSALTGAEWQTRIHWTSNTSLFFDQLKALRSSGARITTIGVTGTKGKSTTTSLIHHVLQTAQLPALLGGNIGKPPLDLLPELKVLVKKQSDESSAVFVVLELSSHQLSDLETSPNIAVIQEIVPEHLDYYANFEAYVDAKSHIARAQHADDLIIYNSDYAIPSQLAQLSAARHRSFTIQSAQQEVARLVALDQLPLKGTHNLLNVMPSLLIAREFGLSTEMVKAALLSFKPLPHRLEQVAEHDGVSYYNDSLSTTPDAASAALSSFAPGHVILLAGGYDRHLDYTQLGQHIVERQVKAVLLFPTTGERIADAITQAATASNVPAPQLIAVSNMDDAVARAAALATSGDVVLLSPASASFNMYTDYQERGEAFRSAVQSEIAQK